MTSRRHSYFSLEEANGLVPTLEHFFREVALIRRALGELREVLESAGARITTSGITLPRAVAKSHKPFHDRYFELCEAYDGIIDEVLALGVEVVDAESGVVNFYSWWDGEEVVFSWQFGEPTVQFWFDPGETFVRRRPIRQLYFDAPTMRIHRH